MKKESLPQVIVILGPTASGKTEWGIKLAKKFNGEVISADSRQVYKKMDIGTAKPKGEWLPPPRPRSARPPLLRQEGIDGGLRQLPPAPSWKEGDNTIYLVEGVPHHLMDIVDPGEEFTVADFKERAQAAIADIIRRGKLPIIVGGTGLYIDTLLNNLDIPRVAPNKKLRRGLEKKPLAELVSLLKNLDPKAADKVDLKNPRRVLRALEVAILTGQSFISQQTKSAPLYRALKIGIKIDRDKLYRQIDARVDEQIKNGLLEETNGLMKQKYGWNLPGMSGLGYKQMGYYLRGEMSLPQAVEVLKRDTRHYAKKQMTWFKRDKNIVWTEECAAAEKEINNFLSARD